MGLSVEVSGVMRRKLRTTCPVPSRPPRPKEAQHRLPTRQPKTRSPRSVRPFFCPSLVANPHTNMESLARQQAHIRAAQQEILARIKQDVFAEGLGAPPFHLQSSCWTRTATRWTNSSPPSRKLEPWPTRLLLQVCQGHYRRPGRSGDAPTRAAGTQQLRQHGQEPETPRVRVHYVSRQSGRGFQKKHMRQVNSKCHNLE